MERTNFNDYLKSNFSKTEITSIDKNADEIVSMYEQLQNSIAEPVQDYIKAHHLKFDDIKKQLETGTSQTQRIINGQGNFTLETILKVAKLIGKKPRLVFD